MQLLRFYSQCDIIVTKWVTEAVILENLINQLRKKKYLSQEELANNCEVSRQTINAIENNKYDPSLILAFKLAKELNSTVDKLFIYEKND